MLLALVSVGHGANVLVVGRYGELRLERPAAEELLQIALSLDGPFGEMDRVISMVSDEQERRALAQSLARISHIRECIGVRILRKLFCDNDLLRPKEIPDANRV
jgi:hypothetical protein